MQTEKLLKEKFEQYKKDEKALAETKKDAYISRVSVFWSAIFEAHFGALIYGLARLCMFVVSKGTVDAINGCIAIAIFGGVGLLTWIIAGSVSWFGVGDTEEWLSDLQDRWRDRYDRISTQKELLASQAERKRFFQFYEMYSSDASFAEQYNKLMADSHVQQLKDFTRKLGE